MSGGRVSLNHAAYNEWAHLGSNQAHAQTAGSDSSLVSPGFAGEIGQANTGRLPLSSTRFDRPDGHQKDTELVYVPAQGNSETRARRAAVERAIAERDGGWHRCFYCGAHGRVLEHVTPRGRRGGSDSIDNLVFACPTCNVCKGDTPGWFFVFWHEAGRPSRAAGSRPLQQPASTPATSVPRSSARLQGWNATGSAAHLETALLSHPRGAANGPSQAAA